MIWLGSKRGYLTDWITQRWVQITGRRVDLGLENWLRGPIAPATGIGPDYFSALAREEGLRLQPSQSAAGVLSAFSTLHGVTFDPSTIDPSVVRFYEQTAAYELDAWAEWCGLFRPFGWLLAVLFSRRLQQLNVPLSGLDTSRGIASEVLQFIDPSTGAPRHTAWYRQLPGTGKVLYAGFYSVCALPGHTDPCVRVVFPLPNGNAIVIMRTESRGDGSFAVISAGDRFGEPGFYFTVHGDRGTVWARYVRALRESIHVFKAESGVLRADHVLTYFGATFLRLHYRMRYRHDIAEPNGPANGSQPIRLETNSTSWAAGSGR
jgi:hypothetical protein